MAEYGEDGTDPATQNKDLLQRDGKDHIGDKVGAALEADDDQFEGLEKKDEEITEAKNLESCKTSDAIIEKEEAAKAQNKVGMGAETTQQFNKESHEIDGGASTDDLAGLAAAVAVAVAVGTKIQEIEIEGTKKDQNEGTKTEEIEFGGNKTEEIEEIEGAKTEQIQESGKELGDEIPGPLPNLLDLYRFDNCMPKKRSIGTRRKTAGCTEKDKEEVISAPKSQNEKKYEKGCDVSVEETQRFKKGEENEVISQHALLIDPNLFDNFFEKVPAEVSMEEAQGFKKGEEDEVTSRYRDVPDVDELSKEEMVSESKEGQNAEQTKKPWIFNYQLPGPIPDVNALLKDKNIFENFFEDVPETTGEEDEVTSRYRGVPDVDEVVKEEVISESKESKNTEETKKPWIFKYQLPGPIPDVNALLKDPSIFDNFFEDLPEDSNSDSE